MRIISITAIALLFTNGLVHELFAQSRDGNGNVTQQERTLSYFNGIEVGGDFEVILLQGAKQSVKVETDENLQDLIKTEVKEDILVISTQKNAKFSEKKIYITNPDFKKIKQSGASEIKSENTINANDLEVEVSGEGELNLMLSAGNLKTELSGAGEVKLSGTAQTHYVEITGAGELSAFELITDTITIEASGAAEARINAMKLLKVEASGAAEIIYKEEPLEKNIDVSGSGEVRKQNGEAMEREFFEEKGDTTKLKIGEIKILIIDDGKKNGTDTISIDKTKKKKNKHKNHWAGIDLGVNGYFTSPPSLDIPKEYEFLQLDYDRSHTWSINFWEQNIRLYQNYVGIVTGMGVEFNKYQFDKQYTLIPAIDSVGAIISGLNYKKNSLLANYLSIPLLLEFNTSNNPKKSFHIAAGIVGGYRIGSKTKQIYEISGKDYKSKIKDDYNLNPFKYSATARIGYGKLNLFATYGLSELFNDKKGPALYPFTLGITLVGFDK